MVKPVYPLQLRCGGYKTEKKELHVISHILTNVKDYKEIFRLHLDPRIE